MALLVMASDPSLQEVMKQSSGKFQA